MLVNWEKASSGRTNNIFRALQNIAPSQLADTRLFDFSNLRIDRRGKRTPYAFANDQLSTQPNEYSLQFFDPTTLEG